MYNDEIGIFIFILSKMTATERERENEILKKTPLRYRTTTKYKALLLLPSI